MSESDRARTEIGTVTGGRVVVTPGEALPYKVVLEHAEANDSEYAFATMREGEAFIRSELPAIPGGLFDFDAARATPSSARVSPQEGGLAWVKDERG